MRVLITLTLKGEGEGFLKRGADAPLKHLVKLGCPLQRRGGRGAPPPDTTLGWEGGKKEVSSQHLQKPFDG